MFQDSQSKFQKSEFLYPIELIKLHARGRWPEILSHLGQLDPRLLDSKHHPCPKCGGNDRFRFIDVDEGALFCNQCFNEKNGDGIAALMWLRGWTFQETLRELATYLNLAPTKTSHQAQHKRSKSSNQPSDETIERWIKAKNLPVSAETVQSFGPIVNERQDHDVLSFPHQENLTSNIVGWSDVRIDGEAFENQKILAQPKSKAGFLGVKPQKTDDLLKLKTIYKVEGLTDCISLNHFIPDDIKETSLVVSNSFGASENMKEAYSELIAGKDIIIIHDLDVAGKAGAKKWAEACIKLGCRVKVIDLKKALRSEHQKDVQEKFDVCDYFRLGYTFDDLQWVIDDTQWQGSEKPSNPSELPHKRVGKVHHEDDLEIYTQKTLRLLERANREHPELFRFGEEIVRISGSVSTGHYTLQVDHKGLREFLVRRIRFVKLVSEDPPKYKKTRPPRDLIENILVRPNLDLLRLKRITNFPIFTASGELIDQPGYSKTGNVYLSLGDLTPPPVSKQPTTTEVKEAARLITEELLGDFPFETESDLANLVGSFLVPLVRDLIDGSTPLHQIEKSTPGTGATLLVEVVSLVVTGKLPENIGEPKDEQEFEKVITAVLLQSPTFVNIDNVKKPLDSGVLAKCLTTTQNSGRILGKSEMARLPVQCVFFATGNNPRLSDELTRRTIPIRLDANCEHPEDRPPESFRHPKLKKWIKDNRSKLLHALLTIVQSWLSAGKPIAPVKSLGSFEEYCEVVGSILHHVGIEGFGENIANFRKRNNQERELFTHFLEVWWEAFRNQAVMVTQLLELVKSKDILLDLGNGPDHSQKIKLGNLLKVLIDRAFTINSSEGLIRITVGNATKRGGSNRWVLKRDDFQNSITDSLQKPPQSELTLRNQMTIPSSVKHEELVGVGGSGGCSSNLLKVDADEKIILNSIRFNTHQHPPDPLNLSPEEDNSLLVANNSLTTNSLRRDDVNDFKKENYKTP